MRNNPEFQLEYSVNLNDVCMALLKGSNARVFSLECKPLENVNAILHPTARYTSMPDIGAHT